MNEKYKTTILLTTHDLSDIEALCERVIMLDEGKIIYDGALGDLKKNWGEGKQVQFEFTEEVSFEKLTSISNSIEVEWQQGERSNVWIAYLSDKEEIVSALIGIVVASFKIKDIKINEISTEEIIRNIYEEGVVHHG